MLTTDENAATLQKACRQSAKAAASSGWVGGVAGPAPDPDRVSTSWLRLWPLRTMSARDAQKLPPFGVISLFHREQRPPYPKLRPCLRASGSFRTKGLSLCFEAPPALP